LRPSGELRKDSSSVLEKTGKVATAVSRIVSPWNKAGKTDKEDQAGKKLSRLKRQEKTSSKPAAITVKTAIVQTKRRCCLLKTGVIFFAGEIINIKIQSNYFLFLLYQIFPSNDIPYPL